MANEDRLKQIACDAIVSQAADLKALSLDIWNHPELCFEEKYAHQTITRFLEERGFSVERSFLLDTAFRAKPNDTVSQNGGANVAILCEYDALPGIGHACGHNLIATIGVAASLGIKAALASSDYKGNGKVSVTVCLKKEYGYL